MASASIDFDRTVVLASADASLRERLCSTLSGLRWQVREARGGAEAIAQLEGHPSEALLLDHWLPDLEVSELAEQIGAMYPRMDLLRVDGDPIAGGTKSPRRHELLHAMREAQGASKRVPQTAETMDARSGDVRPAPVWSSMTALLDEPTISPSPVGGTRSMRIEEFVGQGEGMLELARIIRLVAARKSTVLIEGETGTGKEVVAHALNRLSPRSTKPFIVLNCAPIPETLLEAELFGHTRGAFTGAVQSRTGRIEAAHGGTLFLDEIGEMPLALQAKMLRFLECGELQKVGENESLRVDVRVIAATHQELERRAEEKTFRLDLYHRLAVFPLHVPALRDRMEDLPLLVDFFLEQMGRESPRKGISEAAMARLADYEWPGNVRELMHVLERAAILAEDRAEIGAEEVRLRSTRRTM